MASLKYQTKDGDTVDYICWKHYGSTDGLVVEKVLDANKGLADAGPTLAAGMIISLPDIQPVRQNQGVKLWD